MEKKTLRKISLCFFILCLNEPKSMIVLPFRAKCRALLFIIGIQVPTRPVNIKAKSMAQNRDCKEAPMVCSSVFLYFCLLAELHTTSPISQWNSRQICSGISRLTDSSWLKFATAETEHPPFESKRISFNQLLVQCMILYRHTAQLILIIGAV